MVIVVFTFDVPAEKQADYLKATSEQIKPFMESHGCLAYEVWQLAEDERAPDGEQEFVKTMLFPDLTTTQEFMAYSHSDPDAKSKVALFDSFAVGLKRRTLVKRIP